MDGLAVRDPAVLSSWRTTADDSGGRGDRGAVDQRRDVRDDCACGVGRMIALPAFVDPEAFAGFLEMRRKIRAPLTDRAAVLLLRDLQAIKDAGHDANAALDQSTFMSWRGVFPAREKAIERAPQSQATKTAEYLNERSQGAVKPTAEVLQKLRMVRNA